MGDDSRALKLVASKRALSKDQREALVSRAEKLGFDAAMRSMGALELAPPHDLDAEAAVLSHLMLKPREFLRFSEVLQKDDFYSEANQKIWHAIEDLLQMNREPDIVAINAYFRERNWLVQIGGPSYLAQIIEGTPIIPDANYLMHARTLAKLSRRRKIASTCQVIAAESYNELSEDWETDVLARIHRAAEYNEIGEDDCSVSGAVRDAYDSAVALTQSTKASPWFPLSDLDSILGRELGQKVVLIKGKSGGGKSAFAGAFAVEVAAGFDVEQYDDNDAVHRYWRHKKRIEDNILHIPRGVVLFSLEMRRAEIAMRLCCSQGLVNSETIKHNLMGADDWRRFNAAAQFIQDLPLKIDDRAPLTYPRMKLRIKRIADEFAAVGVRLRLVIVDYAQLLSAPPNSGVSSKEELLSDIGQRVKNEIVGGADSKLCFAWLTQIDKLTGEPKHCKALFEHADIVIKISAESAAAKGRGDSPSMPRRTKIAVEKNRGGRGGDDVFAHGWFHKAFTRFHDAESIYADAPQYNQYGG